MNYSPEAFRTDVLKENLAAAAIAEGHQNHAHTTITELFNDLAE